ncbi:MAG: ABC transporter ATP-binding protein [Longispora sp.]|nr:ABC transporter ATP-binding protein [Longispora sp. (in: high G+C Gram-positive bacteria)]
MIEFDSVTKRFPGGTRAVDDLDLHIADSQITVLVGASGCGKTTILRMINRMIDPTEGRVLIDGNDIRRSDPPTLRRSIGYVIQQAGLFPHRTVARNIATVPLLLGQSRKQAHTRAMELLELVGLPTEYADRYPHQLSGGQQQRVGVARALAADPPILLMDEPFSAVDPVVRASLQQELLRLQAELHKTIVFVTHDVDEAITLGDMIGVFRTGGHLVQYDTPRRLLSHPANSYVADFLGTDRGIRRLSFVPASTLTPRATPVIGPDTTAEQAREHDAAWFVTVDDQRRPEGWLSRSSLPATGTTATFSPLPLGRPFRPDTDPLRAALDSAALSPAGLAVAVDADGRFLGTVDHADIGAEIHTSVDSADLGGELP